MKMKTEEKLHHWCVNGKKGIRKKRKSCIAGAWKGGSVTAVRGELSWGWMSEHACEHVVDERDGGLGRCLVCAYMNPILFFSCAPSYKEGHVIVPAL